MRSNSITLIIIILLMLLTQVELKSEETTEEKTATEVKEETPAPPETKPAAKEEAKETEEKKEEVKEATKPEEKEEVKKETDTTEVKKEETAQEITTVPETPPTEVPAEKKEVLEPKVEQPTVEQPVVEQPEVEPTEAQEKEPPQVKEQKPEPSQLVPPKALVNTKNMILIRMGEFVMGVDQNIWQDDATPKKRVYLSSYYIDKFEVSFSDYQNCVNAGKCKPSKYAQKSKFNKPKLPAIGLSFDDAKVYCEWLGKRLPTEAEWEKAARGQEEKKYTWGNKFSIYGEEKFANVYGKYDGFVLTAPVDSFPNGVSPYGVFNMNGNVREWVSDWYDPEYYGQNINNDPVGPDGGKYKVVRGGSYKNSPPKISTTYRDYEKPAKTQKDLGFRCALSEK